MAITTFDGFIASAKQYLSFQKTTTRTSVANNYFSLFDIAGNPGAGTLAGTSTTAGVVPTDATTGCRVIDTFGGGATGYLARVQYANTVASRLKLFDMVFKAGAYAFTAATTSLSAQPSYGGRMPNGDYGDTQIWIEVSTAFVTGTAWSVQVTYTNQSGTAARTTQSFTGLAAAALTIGKAFPLALQAGDYGVQKIDSVIVTNGGTAMTAGAFNVLVLRPLWSGRVMNGNTGDNHDLAKTGMPVVFDTSALYLLSSPDSTSTGQPELELLIANG